MTHKIAVLVVEDEPIIRLDVIQTLEDEGFSAVEAIHASDAIRVLESRPDIRAVITDVNMPGTMDGLELARLIRNRWPPIHLIIASGRIIPETHDLPFGGRFLRKPYPPKHLIATLRELLSHSMVS